MYDLSLTRFEYDAYLDALTQSHSIRIEIRLLNADEKEIDSLTNPINRVTSGAVQVDMDGEVSRLLDLTVIDPEYKLRFDAGSPANGAVYLDRFIAVDYCVYVEKLSRWVKVPVFWGPVTGFGRDGGLVTIEAQSKERLLRAPHFARKAYPLRKGERVDDAIRTIARKAGEVRLDIPRITGERLKKTINVAAKDEPWTILVGGSDDAEDAEVGGLIGELDVDRQLFYDGNGSLTLRRRKRPVAYTFRTDRSIVGQIGFDYEFEEFRNTVVGEGGAPKGKKKAYAERSLPPAHPLSPENLGRNGVPRHLTEFVKMPNLKKDEKVWEALQEELDKWTEQTVTPSFTCLPIPHLEEGDRCRIRTSEWVMSFVLRAFTIPLVASDSMSIGFKKDVPVRRRKSNRRKPR